MNTFGPPRLVLTRGEGAYVWDDDGNRYLDLLGGIAVNALGHGHPALVEAVTDAARRRSATCRNFFATEPQVELAERLLALLGHGDGPGVLHQLRHRGQRGRLQADPAHRPDPPRRRRGQLPRPHDGRARADVARRRTASRSSRCPATSPSSRTATRRRSRPRSTDETAAVVLEPIQGEAGVVRTSRRLPREGARRSPRPRAPCCGSTRCRPASAAPGHWFAHTDPARRPRRRHRGQGPRRRHPDRCLHRPRRRRPRCSSRATTAPPSAATRWRPRPRSP